MPTNESYCFRKQNLQKKTYIYIYIYIHTHTHTHTHTHIYIYTSFSTAEKI